MLSLHIFIVFIFLYTLKLHMYAVVMDAVEKQILKILKYSVNYIHTIVCQGVYQGDYL